MPTQDKHPSHMRSAGQFNALVLSTCKNPITHENPTIPEYITPSTHKLAIPSTYKLKNSSTQKLINPSTHKLTTPSIYKLKNFSIHELIDSSTRKLNFLYFILQQHSKFHSVLAKIQVEKWVNSHYFQPFMSSCLSDFKNTTCILHHIAFLVCLPTRIFSTPITHFQPLKPHFLMAVLPFSAMCFMV